MSKSGQGVLPLVIPFASFAAYLVSVKATSGGQKQEIRWNGDINNPLWIAQDVCNVLGLDNNREACVGMPESEKGVISSDTLGGKQKMIAVTEAGLYRSKNRSNSELRLQFR